MEAALSGLPGVWTARPLRELLTLASSVWARTDPAPLSEVTPDQLRKHARAVYQVGRSARIQEQYALAVPAFEEAVRLAEVGGDVETVVLATLGLGNVAKQRGAAPRARACYERAERIARRGRQRKLVAMALHDQFSLAVEVEDFERAEILALAVERGYTGDTDALARFGHDAAYLWLMQGQFARSLPVFQASADYFTDVGEQLLAWGCAARAAGGVRDAAAYAEAAAGCAGLFGMTQGDRHEAQAKLNLARGAALIGISDAAERYGREALTLATERGQGLVRFEAEAFLAAPRCSTLTLSPPQACSTKQDALAKRLLRVLRGRRQGV
jgi:tetratricopeptide (TPR) repeat protein